MASIPPPASAARRLAFLGTPEAAVPLLRALVDAGHTVTTVVTRAPARRSRRGGSTPSPVHQAADELGLAVTHDLADLPGGWDGAERADLGVVVAYGRIIPASLLAQLPMVNLHLSLLPRWRGAAPVERAILAGDERTGVCVMEVAEGLDIGGVHARREMAIGPTASAAALTGDLVEVGTELLVATLADDLGPPEPQVGEVTYAEKITADDLRIDWSAPVVATLAQIRVGGAWTTVAGRRLKVWAARRPGGPIVPGDVTDRTGATLDHAVEGHAVPAGDGPLELVVVQPEGKARMEAADWARGARVDLGEALGG